MKKILFIMPLMAISLLASCGGSKPTIKYKLHFNGVDCILLDENKKQITEDKEFLSGQIIYYFIAGKNIEYDVPKQDIVNVTLTDGGEFSDTWRYSETDGSITIKMTADVTINARSVMRPVDDFKVDEQEMKDAFAMKGVEYLQTDCVINTTPSGYNEFTPTSYHIIVDNPYDYKEILILKDGDNYSQYEREGKGDPFEPVPYSGTFSTITDFSNTLFEPIKEKKYEDFYFDEEKKEYMCYFVFKGKIGVTLSQFLKKKIRKFTIIKGPAEVENTSTYTLTYDKIEPPSPTI